MFGDSDSSRGTASSSAHPAGRGLPDAGPTGTFGQPRGPRKERPQAVLEVLSRTRITPNLLRVILGGEEIGKLARNDFTDAYVKLLLPKPGSDLEPPFDMAAIREETPELLPAMRTYTVREWTDQSVALDVVLHGENGLEGIAASWADGALPGDRVAMRGSGGAYPPADMEVRQHLLIGDHSALPAIARSLEEMDRDASGTVIVHTTHVEDRLPLDAPDGVDVRWVDGPRSGLVDALRALPPLDTNGLLVFAHGEREIVKQLRAELVRVREIPRGQISISAYWAQGRIEDEFQAEKRTEIGRIDD